MSGVPPMAEGASAWMVIGILRLVRQTCGSVMAQLCGYAKMTPMKKRTSFDGARDLCQHH
jgi:hypothetical protein